MTNFLRNNNSVYKITYIWLERLFLLLFGFYLMIQTQAYTTFYITSFFYPKTDFPLLYCILAVSLLKTSFLLLSEEENRRRWICLFLFSLLASVIWLLSYIHTRFLFLAYLAVLTVGCLGTDYRTLLKLQVFTVGVVVLSAALCCFGGSIKNLVYLIWSRHTNYRSSWGIDYPTDMAAFYLFLCAAAWMAWDRVPSALFLIPGFLCLWISYEIAQSNTGVICSILFLFLVLWASLLDKKKDGKVKACLQKLTGLCSCCAFPVFSALMVFLCYAYIQGYPFAIRLNEWNHQRLSLPAAAYQNYGIHLFGYPFPMIGGGGSTFSSPGYNYVDCSYLQMLLRYGILVLLMFTILWPLMARTAAKSRHNRLLCGLFLISFHAISEQRFIDGPWNILLAAPFSVLSLELSSKASGNACAVKKDSGSKNLVAGLCAAFILGLSAGLGWKPFLLWFRTLGTVTQISSTLLQRVVLFCFSIFTIAGIGLVCWLLYRITLAVISRSAPKPLHIALLVGCVLISAAVLSRGTQRINRAREEYAPVMGEEASAIQMIENTDGVGFYVTDLPSLYERAFGGTSVSLYTGEDLARLNNIAILSEASFNSTVLIKSGFSYVDLSAQHGLYTDSSALIDAFSAAGIPVTSYYSKEVPIDLDYLARINILDYSETEGLHFSEDHPIARGPYLDFTTADYKFYFHISVPADSADLFHSHDPGEIACKIYFTAYSGNRGLLEYNVFFGDFDERGSCYLNIPLTIRDATDVEIKLFPLNATEFVLSDLYYQISPSQYRPVNLHYLAGLNNLDYTEKQGLQLSEGHPIARGPYLDFPEANYKILFHVSIPDEKADLLTIHEPDEIACKVYFTAFSGNMELLEHNIFFGDFDKDGSSRQSIPLSIPDAADVEIKMFPMNDAELLLDDFFFQMNP